MTLGMGIFLAALVFVGIPILTAITVGLIGYFKVRKFQKNVEREFKTNFRDL